jgi:hypothetical protein
MSQKQKPNLAAALAEVGGGTRRRSTSLKATPTPSGRPKKDAADDEGQGRGAFQAPGRAGTAPITGHFPRQVRDQLKILAIEQSTTLHNLQAEAYNDLFAKYGKPEIARQ